MSIEAIDFDAVEMGTESKQKGEFVTHRSGDTPQPLVVNLHPLASNATPGGDFDALSRIITIPSGSADSHPITVLPKALGVNDPIEMVVLGRHTC